MESQTEAQVVLRGPVPKAASDVAAAAAALPELSTVTIDGLVLRCEWRTTTDGLRNT